MSESGRLVEMGWWSYAERILPKDAPRVQMVECRRAFYAGAAHLFEALTNGVADLSEEDGMKVMQAVHDEFERFVRDVTGGRK